MKQTKKALWMGACGALLAGAALWMGKQILDKKFEIEFIEEEPWEEVPKTELVKVLLTGPRTARVRPTEEEEKEMLRQKLEHIIRF